MQRIEIGGSAKRPDGRHSSLRSNARRTLWSGLLRTAVVPLVVLAGTPSLMSQSAPVPVGPGATNQRIESTRPCPNFHWAIIGAVEAIELVVYRDADWAARTSGSEPTLRVALPAGARGWTPPGSQCLERDQNYVWSLRAESEDRWSDWSEARRFRVGLPGSETALLSAVETLRAYSAPTSEGISSSEALPAEDEALRLEEPKGSPATATPTAASAPSRTSFTGTAVIRGRQRDTSGRTRGVHGISKSDQAGSAGAIGESTATSGPATGVYGRASGPTGIAGEFEGSNLLMSGVGPSGEVFRVQGGGDLMSQGTMTAATFNGDGSRLSEVDADRLGGKDSLGDITAVTAGSGLVGGGTSGDVTLAIGEAAVTSAHLAPSSVGAGQIATNSVGSSEVQDGSVQRLHFETASVGSSDVAVGAVVGGPGGQVADGSLTYHDIDADSVQLRVIGACGPNSSIASIARNGGVTCEQDDLQSFGITAEYSITAFGCEQNCVPMSGANQECFLTQVKMRDSDDTFHDGVCRISRWDGGGGHWLCAGPGACGINSDTYVSCRSRCLTWSDRID